MHNNHEHMYNYAVKFLFTSEEMCLSFMKTEWNGRMAFENVLWLQVEQIDRNKIEVGRFTSCIKGGKSGV